MNQTQARIYCERKKGPLLLKFDFLSKCAGDVICYIDKEPNPSDCRHIWALPLPPTNKVVLYPKLAHNPSFITEHERLTHIKHDPKSWQPTHLHITFQSQSGCRFNLMARFPYEEKTKRKSSSSSSEDRKHKKHKKAFFRKDVQFQINKLKDDEHAATRITSELRSLMRKRH